MPSPIDVRARAARLTELFSPKVIGEVNDVYVKVARIRGEEIPWHTHVGEDELFYVVEGELVMHLEDEAPFALRAGDLFIVPRGTRHRVSSETDCSILLVENKTTAHLGEVDSTLARSVEEQLRDE